MTHDPADQYQPPDLVPDAADFLAFGTLETAGNGHCDIKETHPRSGLEIPFRSGELPQDQQVSTDLPPLISVKVGHALPAADGDGSWHLTASGQNRRSYSGLPITRCLSSTERTEAYTRWRHAEERGTPFTRHITFKPPTDHLAPEESIALWDRVRQRVRCFCRDCRSVTGQSLDCVMMTSRESNPRDSTGEHLHMLVHVPKEYQPAFDRLAPGWFPNTKVTRSNHDEKLTGSGKVKSGFGYLHKAASPQDRKRDKSVWWRSSGAILGERMWSTRNLHAKARAQHEAGRRATVRLHRERGGVELTTTRPEIATAA